MLTASISVFRLVRPFTLSGPPTGRPDGAGTVTARFSKVLPLKRRLILTLSLPFPPSYDGRDVMFRSMYSIAFTHAKQYNRSYRFFLPFLFLLFHYSFRVRRSGLQNLMYFNKKKLSIKCQIRLDIADHANCILVYTINRLLLTDIFMLPRLPSPTLSVCSDRLLQ